MVRRQTRCTSALIARASLARSHGDDFLADGLAMALVMASRPVQPNHNAASARQLPPSPIDLVKIGVLGRHRCN
jgi:hypothetical protein